MEQEEEIRDLNLPVEKLDREDAVRVRRMHLMRAIKKYNDSESDSDDEEDIGDGLLIYDCPPSQDTERKFQWHYPLEFIPVGCVEYDDHYSGGGKWMLFYPVSEIDEKWEMAKGLFDTGELRGVRGMKVSTAKKYPRSFDNTKGLLSMYCGPWTDELLMRKIGRNLALKTEYESKTGCMLYNTDEQTRRGTRATGQAVNHVYQMQVPRPIEGKWRRATDKSQAMWASALDTAEHLPSRDTAERPPSRDTAECPPSRENTNFLQWHRKTLDGIEYDPSTSGKWMLLYPASEIDDRWHLVKSLFDAGELHGVGELQVYTAKGNAGHPDSGVINVFCGPYDDEELMMRIGENLAKKMQYKNRNDFMLYKTKGQQMKQGRAMGQEWDHLYEISLPWRY